MRPAARAFCTAGTIALVSDGVIMKPLAPSAMSDSIAATWQSLSPSTLPAKLLSVTPSSLALASAPSFILTKNGLFSVLVMRPMMSSARAGEAAARPKNATPSTADCKASNLRMETPPIGIRMMWTRIRGT